MILSAVIPVYNAEKYLPKLFETLSSQTFKGVEISIVNDGSTDKSEELILGFIKDNPELKVIYNKIPNSGQGAARELGIKSSTGEYISFIDADDYLEPDYFETFVNAINNYHPDMVCSNYVINEDKKVSDPNYNDSLLTLEEIKEKIYPYLIQNKRYQYFLPTVWAKAFRRDLYVKNICKTNIKVGEDIAVFVPTFLECQSVYLSSKNLYHYRVVNDSVMQIKKPRSYDDVTNLYMHLKEKLSQDNFLEFSLQIDRLIAHVAFNCSITQFYCDKPKAEIKKIIDDNLNNKIISKSISNADAEGFKAKLMLKALRKRKYGLMKLYGKVM